MIRLSEIELEKQDFMAKCEIDHKGEKPEIVPGKTLVVRHKNFPIHLKVGPLTTNGGKYIGYVFKFRDLPCIERNDAVTEYKGVCIGDGIPFIEDEVAYMNP